MSILIKNMKMPKEQPMRIVLNPNGQLFVDLGTRFTEYEAVELPSNENLISREALAKDIGITLDFDCEKCGWYKEKPYPYCSAELDDACFMLENAEIIVPAERSEDA